MTLKKGDEVTPSLDAKLKENMKVVVNHALHVTLIADGKTAKFMSCSSTVGDALKEQGLNLSGKDIVYPSTFQCLKEGLMYLWTAIPRRGFGGSGRSGFIFYRKKLNM